MWQLLALIGQKARECAKKRSKRPELREDWPNSRRIVARNRCHAVGDASAPNCSVIPVGRAKALSFSGCESRPATFAPAGSYWSSRGGSEAAEVSGIEGSLRNRASMQAVM
jgi:hypothetical protein